MTQVGPRPPSAPDDTKWVEAAITFDIEQLTRAKAAADKWLTTLTSILGLFTTVAIVKGNDVLSDLKHLSIQTLIVLATVVALFLTYKAIIKAADGAGKAATHTFGNFDATAYRGWVSRASEQTYESLDSAKRWGTSAVFTLAAIGVLTLVDAAWPADASNPPSVLVVDGQGTLRCGQISSDARGVTTLADQQVSGITNITLVAKCKK